MHGRYGVRSQITAGGVGAIYATDRPAIVYKEYKDPAKAPQRQHLQPLVDIGRHVIVEQRIPVGQRPESSVNWPLDIAVGPGGAVAGVLLPAIPTELYHDDRHAPRDLQFLILRRANPPAADARVALLLRMAEIFAYIDFRKLVYGDVSYRNLVWTLRPQPVMYLIDCDGMLPQEPPPTQGVQSIGFADPRMIERRIAAHDHFSDWYGLALAIYRGLLLRPGNLEKRDGSWPTVSALPPELDARVAALVQRALDHPLDADARPAPAEWVDALRAAFLSPDGAWDRRALQALDRVAEQRPQPSAGFTPLPPIAGTPATTTAPPLRPAPPSQQYRPPSYPTPPAPPPYLPGPPSYPPPAAPPPYLLTPPAPRPVPPTGKRPGTMAQWALTRGRSYNTVSWAMLCCAVPASLVVQLIVLVQLAQTPRYFHGRTRAIVAAAFYTLLSAIAVSYFGVTAVLNLLEPATTPIPTPTDVSPPIDVSPSA